jgi:enoyl-CoA hydratase/carnithine racemase
MMTTLLHQKRDRIVYLTLNRPEAKNAIDPETNALLWRAWEDFRDDDDVDVAILTGSGDAFCAGADLKTYIPPWIGADARKVRANVATGFGGLTRGLHRIYKPVIAAVNGWALAGGLELALACDIRIASDRAQFGSFEARRGYHHGDGGIVRLVNTCGTGVALELVLTAEPIDAQRALRCNLVSRVVPHESLMAEAVLVAQHILRNDQVAVRSAKETILDVIGRPLDDQLRIEALNGYSSSGPDTADRLRQFRDKSDSGRAGTHATSLPKAAEQRVTARERPSRSRL